MTIRNVNVGDIIHLSEHMTNGTLMMTAGEITEVNHFNDRVELCFGNEYYTEVLDNSVYIVTSIVMQEPDCE